MSSGLVALEKWAIGFLTKKQMGGKPAACMTCSMWLLNQQRCAIIGRDIIIAKCQKDGKTFTPTCSEFDYGLPMIMPDEKVHYSSGVNGPEKADAIGLEWAEGTGTNCGGEAGAAPCTAHFDPDTGGCRPLQEVVASGDCCGAHGGPAMSWREAQVILKT